MQKLTQTSPLAELLSVRNLDERNLVLGAQRDNKLLVRLLLARLVEHTHVRLATVERLGRLAQTAGESVVDQSDLENALQSVQHGHAAASGVGVDFDFVVVGGDLLADFLGWLFYIRLRGVSFCLSECVNWVTAVMIVVGECLSMSRIGWSKRHTTSTTTASTPIDERMRTDHFGSCDLAVISLCRVILEGLLLC